MAKPFEEGIGWAMRRRTKGHDIFVSGHPTSAAAGFGLWCDAPLAPAAEGFDPLLGLRAIGYDMRQQEAAIGAFRMHFLPDAPAGEPIERDSALIQCLMQASLAR